MKQRQLEITGVAPGAKVLVVEDDEGIRETLRYNLARAGFEIARQPVTKVDFEVHHAMARHGYLRELVSADSDSAVFLETLCSATNGAGARVGASACRFPPLVHRHFPAEGEWRL